MAKAKFDHAAFAEGLAQKRHDEISTLLRKLIDSCRTDHPDMQRAFTQRDVTIRRVNDVQEKMSSNHTLIMDTLNNILQTVQLNKMPPAPGAGNKHNPYDRLTTPKTPMFKLAPDKQLDPYADVVKAIFGDTTVPVGVARDMHRLEERVGTLELALDGQKAVLDRYQVVLDHHRNWAHQQVDRVNNAATDRQKRDNGVQAEFDARIRSQANALDRLTTRVMALESSKPVSKKK